MVPKVVGGDIMKCPLKNYHMKKIKRRHLSQELKKILSKRYYDFSKKERLIIGRTIEELSKPENNWIATTGKFLKRAVPIIKNVF